MTYMSAVPVVLVLVGLDEEEQLGGRQLARLGQVVGVEEQARPVMDDVASRWGSEQ